MLSKLVNNLYLVFVYINSFNQSICQVKSFTCRSPRAYENPTFPSTLTRSRTHGLQQLNLRVQDPLNGDAPDLLGRRKHDRLQIQMSSTCGLYYLPYTTGSKLNEDPLLLSSSQVSGICRSRRERRSSPTWPPANCDASSLWVRQCLWKLS